MGNRKYRIVLSSLFAFFFQVIFLSCVARKIYIKNCLIENEKMIINLQSENFFQSINGVDIYNKKGKDYYSLTSEDLNCRISDNQTEIIFDCSNIFIEPNKEYQLTLHFSGGYVSARFVLENTEKCQIVIQEQSSIVGM